MKINFPKAKQFIHWFCCSLFILLFDSLHPTSNIQHPFAFSVFSLWFIHFLKLIINPFDVCTVSVLTLSWVEFKWSWAKPSIQRNNKQQINELFDCVILSHDFHEDDNLVVYHLLYHLYLHHQFIFSQSNRWWIYIYRF